MKQQDHDNRGLEELLRCQALAKSFDDRTGSRLFGLPYTLWVSLKNYGHNMLKRKGVNSMINTDPDHKQAVKTIHELIKDIDTAMLTTVSREGLVSRPMKTQDVEFDGNLWFLTKKDSDKFHELLHNNQVNVSYAGKSFVSIRGQAELVEDTEKIKQFWNPMYEKLLGTTYDDPNLVLIKVNAETAEYWDSSNKFKMVRYALYRLLGQNTEGTNMNQTVKLT